MCIFSDRAQQMFHDNIIIISYYLLAVLMVNIDFKKQIEIFCMHVNCCCCFVVVDDDDDGHMSELKRNIVVPDDHIFSNRFFFLRQNMLKYIVTDFILS